jgi:hypothetical protein
MRYRHQSKVKKQHHLIPELGTFLKSIEPWPEITAINPGVIATCGYNGRLKFSVSYRRGNSIRCLGRCNGAVQEVFLVCHNAEVVAAKLSALL